jgi:hypothetical protein
MTSGFLLLAEEFLRVVLLFLLFFARVFAAFLPAALRLFAFLFRVAAAFFAAARYDALLRVDLALRAVLRAVLRFEDLRAFLFRVAAAFFAAALLLAAFLFRVAAAFFAAFAYEAFVRLLAVFLAARRFVFRRAGFFTRVTSMSIPFQFLFFFKKLFESNPKTIDEAGFVELDIKPFILYHIEINNSKNITRVRVVLLYRESRNLRTCRTVEHYHH